MNILLISPIDLPYNRQSRYVGVEKLVYEFSVGLTKLGHEVTISAHVDSEYPPQVKHLKVTPGHPHHVEVGGFLSYSYLYRNYDVIHDFSHLHLASRMMKLPSVNIFWHAPGLPGWPNYSKAPYNIVALSQWAVWEFNRVYKQGARYQQTIAIPDYYYNHNPGTRGSRLLSLGRMGPEKGNLQAAMLATELGLELDIAGGRGTDKSTTPDNYIKHVEELCDGQRIALLGEVDETKKLSLLQSAKALIYITNHPEVTSLKSMEALACGCPVICPAIGAMPELIQHGYNGYLCRDKDDYKKAVDGIDNIDPANCVESARQWQTDKVVSDYTKVYKGVAAGERW